MSAITDLDAAIRLLDEWGACDGEGEALPWLRALPTSTSPEHAYAICDRGDWLLWLARTVQVDRKRLVLAACACARPALVHARDAALRTAVEVAEAWARGEATDAVLSEARTAVLGFVHYEMSATPPVRPSAQFAATAAYAAIAEASPKSDELLQYFGDAATTAACSAAYYASGEALMFSDDWAGADAAYIEARAKAHAEQAVSIRALIPWPVIAAAVEACHASQ